MATKPAPAVRARWNTGGDNRVTPAGGKITLGWELGEEPSSAYFNWYMYENGEIGNWVLDGSSAGAADAHIVETDSLGATVLRALTILGGTATTVGLAVTGTTGAGPATGIRGTGVGAAPGVSGIGGAGAAAGSGDARTGGYGLRGISGGHATTAGVLGIGANGTNADGGHFYGDGDGDGIYGEAEGALGAGVHGVGPGFGVFGEGVGVGVGGLATDPDGDGILGTTHASANATSYAVRGSAFGDGVGLYGVAVNGYGVVAQSDTSSPTRAAFRIVPQDATPSTRQNGDIWQNSSTDELTIWQAGAARPIGWRTLGQCYGYGFAAGPVTDNSGTYTDVISAVLGSPNDPKRTGDVRIRVTAEVGRDTSAAGNIQIRVRDVTAGANAGERTIELFQAVGTYERDVAWEFNYTLPGAGARTFTLQMRRSGGSDVVAIRNASITVDGVF